MISNNDDLQTVMSTDETTSNYKFSNFTSDDRFAVPKLTKKSVKSNFELNIKHNVQPPKDPMEDILMRKMRFIENAENQELMDTVDMVDTTSPQANYSEEEIDYPNSPQANCSDGELSYPAFQFSYKSDKEPKTNHYSGSSDVEILFPKKNKRKKRKRSSSSSSSFTSSSSNNNEPPSACLITESTTSSKSTKRRKITGVFTEQLKQIFNNQQVSLDINFLNVHSFAEDAIQYYTDSFSKESTLTNCDLQIDQLNDFQSAIDAHINKLKSNTEKVKLFITQLQSILPSHLQDKFYESLVVVSQSQLFDNEIKQLYAHYSECQFKVEWLIHCITHHIPFKTPSAILKNHIRSHLSFYVHCTDLLICPVSLFVDDKQSLYNREFVSFLVALDAIEEFVENQNKK